jgi:hypothetical protein
MLDGLYISVRWCRRCIVRGRFSNLRTCEYVARSNELRRGTSRVEGVDIEGCCGDVVPHFGEGNEDVKFEIAITVLTERAAGDKVE